MARRLLRIFERIELGQITMSLSRYVCIYITRDRTIRDVTTLHAADDSEGCEQALAGCLARHDANLGYELWRPKRWVATYCPKEAYAPSRHPVVAALVPEASGVN